MSAKLAAVPGSHNHVKFQPDMDGAQNLTRIDADWQGMQDAKGRIWERYQMTGGWGQWLRVEGAESWRLFLRRRAA